MRISTSHHTLDRGRLEMNSYRPKKSLGQHFLTDKNAIDQMIECLSPTPEEYWIEIGPGQGALTRFLVPLVKELIGIEIDKSCIETLQKNIPEKNVQWVHQNILETDLKKFTQAIPFRLVGNLPYYITTPILFHCFDQLDAIRDMHFLIQKEVADRLTATPSTKDYGRLTIMAQYFCSIEKLFDIAPHSFYPPPKVFSTFIRLQPTQAPIPLQNFEHFSKIVLMSFQHRRKIIKYNLKAIFQEKDWENMEFDWSLRAENFSLTQYILMSNYLTTKIQTT